MKLSSADIVSAPNAISLAGFALAVHGARRLDTSFGLTEVVLGRSLDLVDGHVARMTGQTSELGAATDATLDKFAGLAIIASEWQKDIAPKPVLTAMLTQNVLNSAATAVAAKKHPESSLAPSKNGKYAMAAQNLALASYAQAEIIKGSHPTTSTVLRYVGHTAALVGVGYFGSKATAEYLKRARS